MGLFGLFTSIVGLGAMVKDGIERSFSESDAYKKALQSGSLYYFTGDGAKMNSIKTRRQCLLHYENGHLIITDAKTGNFIEDATLTQNLTKEAEARLLLPNDCIFYRKYDCDNAAYKANIWVSDVIPGYFFHRPSHYKAISSEIDEFSLFDKGELGEYRKGKKKVETYIDNGLKDTYFADGTKFTNEEQEKRELNWLRQLNKNKGYVFYPIDKTARSGGPNHHQSAVNPDQKCLFMEYRHVDTDELFVSDRDERYLVKAIKKEQIINVAKPHHEPIWEKKTYYVADPKGERFNPDGTKWYP